MVFRFRRAFQAYRIADRRHPLFDGTGAMLFGGRWNSPGRRVICASASYACAMLEVLVHTGMGRIALCTRVLGPLLIKTYEGG